METTVLIVPGPHNSGPVHWQSLWQLKHPEYVRVRPEHLDRAIRDAFGRVFIVAHGLGSFAAIRRLGARSADVAGALLVAPEKWGQTPFQAVDECPIPTTLVASRNDPCLPFHEAAQLARRLGSRFVSAGAAGHIDAESGYGAWPEGERLLSKLMAQSRARERDLKIGLALGG
jgi:predicted alpha/beta hydrolase family esterase